MPNSLSDLLLFRRRRRGVPRFDIYVDSVNGDDGNDGLSPSAAVQSLVAAAALLSNGASLGLARGSVWNTGSECIDKPALAGVTVDAYGTGAKPVIDCANVLSGFVAGAEPDVYKVTGIALVGSGTHYTHVQWNGHILQGKTSEASCSADPGSFYITAQSGTVDIYVHAPNSEDLTGAYSGEYRYGAREYSIRLGADATVRNIETGNNRHNDGSVVVGLNSLVEYNRIRNGGKHSMMAGFGSRVQFNDIFEAHNHTESGVQIIIYTGTAPGGSGVHSYIEENTFTLRGLYASPTNQSCTYCHTSSGNVNGNFYVRGNTYTDVFGALDAGAGNITGDYYWDDNYVTLSEAFVTMPYAFASPYIFGGKYVRNNKVWFPEPWAITYTPTTSFYNAGRTCEFDGNELYLGPYFTYVVAGLGGSPDITARNNVGSMLASGFIRAQASSNVLRDVTGNIIAINGRPIDTTSSTTVAGTIDGNHWLAAARFRIGNVSKTWLEWVALGYDLTADAAGDNKACAVPRDGALLGGLADWPETWLHINAQETGSITQVGGFVSAVADLGRAGRDLVLHEPTPGTDKVSISTQNGLPYFAPVANGGLKYTVQDYNMQLSIVAAVVRLNFDLSAANSLGTLFCSHQSDDTEVRLGSVSGSFTNEIVTAKHASNAGYTYAHASDSFAANSPHLLVLYRDPVDGSVYLRIDGALIGAASAVGSVNPFVVGGNKTRPLMLMRGNSSADALAGYLGELFLGGPMSLDVVSDIETEMLARWGIS